jgi:hypothetical protein
MWAGTTRRSRTTHGRPVSAAAERSAAAVRAEREQGWRVVVTGSPGERDLALLVAHGSQGRPPADDPFDGLLDIGVEEVRSLRVQRSSSAR